MTAEYIRSVFQKYGTDKAGPDHDYSEFYAQHLPEDPRKILEIGVKEGASIRAWKEIFPDAEIHGLDLFEEFPIPDIPGVTWYKGNQCDWRILEELRKEGFDMIVDDGSHMNRHQLMTFFGLAAPGCYYFIEDVYAESFYTDTLPVPLYTCNVFPSLEWDGLLVYSDFNIHLIKC